MHDAEAELAASGWRRHRSNNGGEILMRRGIQRFSADHFGRLQRRIQVVFTLLVIRFLSGSITGLSPCMDQRDRAESGRRASRA